MKLTSIILLGLSMTAAMASGDANLRANTSSRQLRNSGQGSGGTWVWHLMLNCLHGPADLVGIGACGKSECNKSTSTSGGSSRELWETDGYSTSSWGSDGHSSSSSSWGSDSHSSSSSSSKCPSRCHAPHLHPPHLPKPPKKPSSSGKKSSSSSGKNSSGKYSDGDSYTTNDKYTNDDNGVAWGDDGYKSASSGNGDDEDGENASGNGWYNDDAENSEGGSDDNSGENNDGDHAYGVSDDESRNQYLSNNNGNGGNAVQINSGKSMPVWPFLVAALAVGVVAAALIANRRKQARRGNHALNGSIKRRMELFSGGLPRKEKPAAESSLYENDYENEPSYVEMGGPEEQTPAAESSHYEMRDPDGR